MNVIAKLNLELAYLDVAVQRISNCRLFRMVFFFFFCYTKERQSSFRLGENLLNLFVELLQFSVWCARVEQMSST